MMTPHQFLAEVVQPNMEDALRHPGDLRLACNAIHSMDDLMGITFWHLHALGDQRVKVHGNDDSSFKSELARPSDELRALLDASYALKHGRLTRKNPVINSASQVKEGANVLGYYFRAGTDELGGQLVYLEVTAGIPLAARDVIAEAYRILKPYVDGLP